MENTRYPVHPELELNLVTYFLKLQMAVQVGTFVSTNAPEQFPVSGYFLHLHPTT